MTESCSDNLNKRVGKQREDRRSEERSQEHQQARTQVTKASMPSPPKETQSPLTSPLRKSYAQMAASVSPKVTTENAWMEATGSSRKQKANTPQKVEPEKRRVIFRRATTSPEKPEADLMLVLNEALQRVNLPAYIRFSRERAMSSRRRHDDLTDRKGQATMAQ